MRILGLDGGMASVGWAVIDLDIGKRQGEIAACGTRMFNSPEETTQNGLKLKNAERRGHRLARRVLRRRRQRMRDIRQLFAKHGLLIDNRRDALAGHGADPWSLRAEALDRELKPCELALVLGHIAKHRGFKSNKKGERANKADDASKMLSAIDETREKLAKHRTVGEMFAHDPVYANRKRNREGDYTRSILRCDHKREVRAIFAAQRKRTNVLATEELEKEFTDIAFFQRPLQSSLELVGECPFVEGEKRASAFAPSFERFRLLSKLVTLRIVSGREVRALDTADIGRCLSLYGRTKGISYKALRRVLGLDDSEKFDRIGPDKEHSDFVHSAGALTGTRTLIDVLTAAGISAMDMQKLLAEGETLDRVMTVIAFNEDMEEIRDGLQETDLPREAVDALYKAAEDNAFQFVKGTGHISTAAARRLNPHLEAGMRYDEACAAEGWDHAAQRAWILEDIKSPVAQKAAREMMKQVKVLERKYGPFDRINVEMARDVGKGIEERGKIERGINRRTAERQKAEQELKDLLKITHVSSEDILRYELWKEQQGRCLYTGKGIPGTSILASDNSVQVDHILPWSRFGDNSYLNKTLCFTKPNQDKKIRTPFEWKDEDDSGDWERFRAEVESCKTLKGMKRRNYLLMDAVEREGKFLERNLNDTRYALKIVLGLLRRNYADETIGQDKDGTDIKRRRVFARPGAITSALRRIWGVESLKKDEKGDRLPDDRHHALDAIITACCSEELLQRATHHAQAQERRGEKFEFRHLDSPWGEKGRFRREVEQAVENVFVSRPESGRLRGKAHDATIKQIREIDGEKKLFERKAVGELKLKDLERIPVPEPYGRIADPAKLRGQMVENLRAWLEERAALDTRIKEIEGKSEKKTVLQRERAALKPLSPKGDVIRKVRLEAENKMAVEVRGGSADRADMVRVDVFSKPNRKGVERFYLVPVYRNDVYNEDETLNEEPPNRAVASAKPESKWPVMDETFRYRFSVVSFSFLEVIKPDGEVIAGYFRGLDRSTGAITVSPHENSAQLIRSIGARNLRSIKKFHVDRLGNIHEIKEETRTWRGKVCILSLVRRRLPEDWTARYNTAPVLIETFVETPRYTGAVYKASGWIPVGTTQGRGRYDRDKLHGKPRKDIWLRPLRKNWKQTLNR